MASSRSYPLLALVLAACAAAPAVQPSAPAPLYAAAETPFRVQAPGPARAFVQSAPSRSSPRGHIAFASGPDWESFGGDEVEDLGPAREVCVSETVPMDCPGGALLYRDSVSRGWGAFDGLPSVHWIWLANVDREQRADDVQAQFAKSFTVGASPRGRITVAADDFAAVFVNQVLVGVVGSTSVVSAAWNGQNNATSFDLTPALRAGRNTITILAKNGPPSFASCPDECTYNENPAGVAFTGTLSW